MKKNKTYFFEILDQFHDRCAWATTLPGPETVLISGPEFQDWNRSHHSHGHKNRSRIKQELQRQPKYQGHRSWGHGPQGRDLKLGPEKNRTAITGPKLLRKRDQETEMEIEIERELSMGPELWDRKSKLGHGTDVTGSESRDRSHRIRVITETDTEAKSWRQGTGNM
jgi:hypothetical protein